MKIIQLTNTVHPQMMAYAVQAKTGEYIFIDGGHSGDAPEVARVIRKLGAKPEAWFLNHPHTDHYQAIQAIYDKDPAIAADVLYQTAFPEDYDMAEEQEEYATWRDYAAGLSCVRYMEQGQVFTFGSMKITVLGVANPEIRENICNNQSAVLMIEEGGFRFLVLGDLGVEAGEKLMQSGADLRADAVQMAHHGQSGVDQPFYRAVAPRWAFWPTPTWLWENNYRNEGFNTGHWETLTVRGWMKELGAKDFTTMEHTAVFDTETETIEEF